MAIVQKMTLTNGQIWDTVLPYLENNWTWPGGVVRTVEGGDRAYFYIDEAKTIGILFIKGAEYFNYYMGVIFKGTEYHNIEFKYNTTNKTFMIEITNTALIISAVDNSASINAANCEKIIVHNAINPKTNTTQQVISYIGNKSSNNVSAMYASDVMPPADMSEQNGGVNVNSAQSVFVQLCNKASDFIATDVYKCLCSSLSGWSFGDSIIDGHRYRMSGSIFALDE